MGGGLLQLVAHGAQDAYLTGNPQITFWKGLFKRHTNFAMEPFRINLTGMPVWGQKQSATIGRHADLIYSTYLEVSLKEGLYNNDQRRLGYNLLRYVELEVGGQLIDRLYGEWLFLWDSLTSDVTTGLKLHAMVASGLRNSAAIITEPESCASNTGRPSKPTTLYVPLPFFYTRNPGAALPLIALQYHDVKINVLWNSPQLVAGNFNQLNLSPNPSSAAIYVDYIYLDVDERRRMAQESHEYLMEQVQYNEDKGITSASQRIDLTFNHPVKELVWVVQPTNYTNCKLKTDAGGSNNRSPTVYPVNSPIAYNAATAITISSGTLASSFIAPGANSPARGSLVLTPTYTLSSVYGLLPNDTVTIAGITTTATVNSRILLDTIVTGASSDDGSVAVGALFSNATEVIASVNYATKQVTMRPKSYVFTRTTNDVEVTYETPVAFTAITAGTLLPNDAATDTNRLTPFTYDKDAVFSQHLQFNGQDRLDKRFGDYYNKVQPFQHHTGSTASVYDSGTGGAISTAQPGVYCYSFALKPEEQQPSGTCNFSRIDTATIVMSIDGSVPINASTDEYDVRVYAINYNILRIMSGMCGLAYSN